MLIGRCLVLARVGKGGGGAGEYELSVLVPLIDFIANLIPDKGNDLPLVDEAGGGPS